jgi:hypothetical protein
MQAQIRGDCARSGDVAVAHASGGVAKIVEGEIDAEDAVTAADIAGFRDFRALRGSRAHLRRGLRASDAWREKREEKDEEEKPTPDANRGILLRYLRGPGSL